MAKPAFDPTLYQTVYVDETSQTKHRFLALGAVIIHTECEEALAAEIAAARLPELPNGEMGWTKVSRTKLPAYMRVVDAFFDNASHHMPYEFHSLTVDTRQIRDKVWNDGSREVGFNKEIFQICAKVARLHWKRLIRVYLDSRDTKSSTEELRLILNRYRANKGDKRDWPFRRIHFRNSASCQIMQLVDVLLGAVAYQLNEHHLAPGASAAKTELSTHILKRAKIVDVKRDSAVSGRFTLWHRQLK